MTDEFDGRIERLDLSLFHALPTISSDGDRTSWLAIQRAARRRAPAYTYLEVGPYLGGSLQQYYLDPKCSRIFAIDKRPEVSPDERGDGVSVYGAGIGERMMDGLRSLDAASLAKVTYFEADVSELAPGAIDGRPDVCFIDGEHTTQAVVRDFEFCLGVCADDATIYFHDADVVWAGLRECLRTLRQRKTPFRAAKLKGTTFAVGLGSSPLSTDETLRNLSSDGDRFLLAARLYDLSRHCLPGFVTRFGRRVGKRLFSQLK